MTSRCCKYFELRPDYYPRHAYEVLIKNCGNCTYYKPGECKIPEVVTQTPVIIPLPGILTIKP